MNTMNQEAPERQEIEALLPWHAAGTLSRGDAERVERALSCDRELARRFDLVREELHETIHLNELLGHPSSRAADKLFAAIEAEGARAPARRSFDLAGRVAAFLSSLTPRTLAYAAGAAALVVLVQSAVMTSVLLKSPVGTSVAVKDQGVDKIELAEAPTAGESKRILVRFAPQATSADITKFLNTHKAEMVGGPADGYYRLAVKGIPNEGLHNIVRQMQGETKIVDFVATKN
jgi:anti-sigma-K factor RskA